ncbi:putative serine protease [Candidatus Gastranaerophilus sp. (ex Termes propinquus)]|nr:putative serine protease [Candidatus Gastranaerophilus sp. (ex Termes propinquus)]
MTLQNGRFEQDVYVRIYEDITPAIVSIEADLPDGLSSGTGCVIDKSGIILTSLHVIKGARSIEVTTFNGQTYKAEVSAVLKDNNDLALIKITPKYPLATVTFGDSTQVRAGQQVLAIGNPFGFRGTLTTGIVSRIDYQRNKIQTDAAINPGCSGGPLLNLRGEVIGINQSIYNPDNNRSNIGIGFAVPVNNAKEFITLVKKKNSSIAWSE